MVYHLPWRSALVYATATQQRKGKASTVSTVEAKAKAPRIAGLIYAMSIQIHAQVAKRLKIVVYLCIESRGDGSRWTGPWSS